MGRQKMICLEKALRYCSEDISLIENYDKAINDADNLWVVHHRDEIRVLPSGMIAMRSKADLEENGRYWLVPANELIFMLKKEHMAMHAHYQRVSPEARQKMRAAKLGKPISRKFYSPSMATREKLRAAQTGKRLSTETRRKISDANLKRWALRRIASN
jgi:hypothetical protein